ncbi:hypothetical protein [Acinetobacter variabilis]|uniref:Uncharacterized protein n=1 Tax=Acinetobacter variabilis TaxID=70346 RepID=N9P1R9_9GAMM|nr:hypothetical protein [Acinetobacter variabilis]ENX08857.1 hypothetical protein F897_02008 [Acinetobacter variabilis]UBI31007.1 hypothetical protein LA331_02205 [Acinetobacter variabilis]
MSVISEYKDSSGLTTYPAPLTDHAFAGLNEQENIDFKIWLDLIGENEIEVAADQKLETYFVKAFKEQKEDRCQYMNPAQKTSLISFWFLHAEAGRVCAGLRHGCEFWQLVDWAPTQEEFNKAFPAPESLELEYAPPMEPVKSEPVKQPKAKAKPARDEWTLDLFGGAA